MPEGLSPTPPPTNQGRLPDLDQVEEDLMAARVVGDAAAIERLGAVWIEHGAHELSAFRVRLSARLRLLDRPHRWSIWEDDGLFALRIRVDIGDAGMIGAVPGITWWIREGDHGPMLLVDHVDSPVPTDFAWRMARTFAEGAFGFKTVERLIISQVSLP